MGGPGAWAFQECSAPPGLHTFLPSTASVHTCKIGDVSPTVPWG